MDNKDAIRQLKLVPTPAPDSLTPEEKILLLQKGDPNGPIVLECSKPRPYLGVVSGRALAQTADSSTLRPAIPAKSAAKNPPPQKNSPPLEASDQEGFPTI